MQTTLIPINENAFFTPYLWQSDVFQGKPYQKSNQCLRKLMQAFSDKDTIETCKSAPQRSNFAKLGKNIYSIEQRVNNITGRIVM